MLIMDVVGKSRGYIRKLRLVNASPGCLPGIQSLPDLRCTPSDHDMQSITRLTNLRELSLSCMSSITNQHIRHLPSLPNLSINSCDSISDYSPVGSCMQLRELKTTTSTTTLQCVCSRGVAFVSCERRGSAQVVRLLGADAEAEIRRCAGGFQ